jgi:hypothetical protein
MLRNLLRWSALGLLFMAHDYCLAQEISEETTGQYSTREMIARFEAVGPGKITIKSAQTLRGVIKISTSEDDGVEASYFKKAKTSSLSRAIDYIDLIAVTLEKTPDGARLEMRAPNPAPWKNLEAGIVEVTLTVPESCSIQIAAEEFDVDAVGPFKAVLVPSSLGRIDVVDVTGRLEIATANRRVSIERIAGEVAVTTSNSSLVASAIDCSGRQGSFKNESGDIKIDGFVGSIDVKNSYGRIDILGFVPRGENNFIRGSSEPIMVAIKELGPGTLVVDNQFEDIEINVPDDISAAFSLSVEEDGKIEALNFPFRAELVTHDRMNLVAGDGTSLVRAAVHGRGNVFVRGHKENE